jgi:HTH-type transcriptional regulator/antitoxin HigA
MLKAKLAEKGWSMEELEAVTRSSRQNLSLIIAGKRSVTPDMAVTLAAAFGNDAAEWLKWEAEHQLSLVETDPAEVANRARLYSSAPVREMQKRGWLPDTASTKELAASLDRFFTNPDGRQFSVATLRRGSESELSPAEKAWCFRARALAETLPFVAEFDKSRLPAAEKKLRQLAAYEEEAMRVAEILSYYGIRFVVVEPLPGAEIDGAAFWIGESPVLALSIRLDRIDAFWFTLMHEFAHIRNGDAYSLDISLVAEGEHGLSIATSDDDAERRANMKSADTLVPQSELDSFVARTSPRYAATRIIQFAHSIQMHPGVIVGQLQHRGELSYSSHRGFLVRVRAMVTDMAVTDGWGHTPSAR